jgi:hypothetical protein
MIDSKLKIMITKLLLWLLWAAFVIYTLLLAPLDQPGNLTIIEKLVKLQLEGINPYLVTLFSFMGVWPMVYACLMFIDARMQDISAFPAFLASNGAGAIAMIPYLLVRHSNQDFRGQKDFWLNILDSRWMGIGLGFTTLGLLAYAILLGDWQNFVQLFLTNRFVHCMSLDFCLMCLVFPALLADDMARRGLEDSRIFWTVSLTPLLGAITYLCLRPPLPESGTEISFN